MCSAQRLSHFWWLLLSAVLHKLCSLMHISMSVCTLSCSWCVCFVLLLGDSCLQVCADTIVGNQMLRGVSGGQRKRVTTGEVSPQQHVTRLSFFALPYSTWPWCVHSS